MKTIIVSLVLLFALPALAQVTGTPSPVPSVAAVVPVVSGGLLSWLGANWQNLLLAVLAIDAALIPLFPNTGLLVTIKNLLSGLTSKT